MSRPRRPQTQVERRQLQRLAAWFQAHAVPSVGGNKGRHVASMRAAAVALGVSERSLRRWLRGEAVPTQAQHRALVAWREAAAARLARGEHLDAPRAPADRLTPAGRAARSRAKRAWWAGQQKK